jgi:hypothetical protein
MWLMTLATVTRRITGRRPPAPDPDLAAAKARLERLQERADRMVLQCAADRDGVPHDQRAFFRG